MLKQNPADILCARTKDMYLLARTHNEQEITLTSLSTWNYTHWAKKKILFDCPHPTEPDFENLFIFFFLFYCTKEYRPCFWKFLKFFLFWNFCILKHEKDCVLEVCIKHVTCFKCTICILHQHLRCVWCLEHLLRDKCIHALGVYCHL